MRVVIVGGGLGGLRAALRATELGAQATLLEKGTGPGGSFVYSSGYIWSYVDLPTFRREAPGGDAALQRLILERLGSDLTWLEGAGGVLLSRETGNPLTFGARSRRYWRTRRGALRAFGFHPPERRMLRTP